MTFAPPPSNRLKRLVQRPADSSSQVLDEAPGLLNELYCRYFLREVPGIVERTIKMRHLTLPNVPRSEFAYLREAVNCYLLGLPHAAVVMARAALEDCLRDRLAKHVGKSTVAGLKLNELIKDRTLHLSPQEQKWAHNVQNPANIVLHNRTAGAPVAIDVALTVIEDARELILSMTSPR